MQVFLQNPPTIRIGGQVSKSLYQFSMQSPNREALYEASRNMVKALGDVSGLEDLTSDLEVTSPQVNVEIDRDKAAALGVTANAIENAFYDAYGPRWVSTIYAPVNEYKVLLELAPQFQADPAALSLLYFKAAGNAGGGGRGERRRRRRDGGGTRGGRRGGRHATGGVVVPLDTLAQGDAGHRPADGESLRTAAGGDDLVRPRARRLARRRAQPRARRGGGQPARRRQRTVPGRREGVPELAVQPLAAARRRDPRRLHRARASCTRATSTR